MNITLTSILIPSNYIVSRFIEDELIIVPLTSVISDAEDELYSMNVTGKDIWRLLDGKNTLGDVVNKLSQEYDSDPSEIEQDVLGLTNELVRRRMLTVVPT
jgi:hypothetical protein